MSTKDELKDQLVKGGFAPDQAETLVGRITDEQAAEALAGMLQADAEKEALKARLMADPALRSVVCPATTWGSPEARFQVSQTALKVLEATVAKNKEGLTLDTLVAAMVSEGFTMQAGVEFLLQQGSVPNGDPRFDSFSPGNSFYFFKCRVRDAMAVALQDVRKAARDQETARQDAKWEAQGLTRCTRCGGQGGFSHWPGFTCYECGGLGAV